MKYAIFSVMQKKKKISKSNGAEQIRGLERKNHIDWTKRERKKNANANYFER